MIKKYKKTILALGALSMLTSCSDVPVGHVGIKKRFSQVVGDKLESGWYFTGLFTTITALDIRTQHEQEKAEIPTVEMLNMVLETSVNYRIDPNQAVSIYKTIGTGYFKNFLEPHLRSAIREVTSGLSAHDLFSAKREAIAVQIKEKLIDKTAGRGFIIEDVMLKNITPPASLSHAIEKKQAQQQEAEAMKFRLEREKLEAQRKKIEAQGIQEFQEIVKKGIDENLLAWKGIEATETLAKSPNTKIIVIGNKDNGLPLILGDK
jgi:regulator of protease activity HflC (stomatin/prohibitin superfamily)